MILLLDAPPTLYFFRKIITVWIIVADKNGNPTGHLIFIGDGTGSPVSLSNIDRGPTNTDAVNVGRLGGGASINADGSITGQTYNIDSDSYHNVGDVFSATNNRIDILPSDTAYQISRLDGRISAVKNEA